MSAVNHAQCISLKGIPRFPTSGRSFPEHQQVPPKPGCYKANRSCARARADHAKTNRAPLLEDSSKNYLDPDKEF